MVFQFEDEDKEFGGAANETVVSSDQNLDMLGMCSVGLGDGKGRLLDDLSFVLGCTCAFTTGAFTLYQSSSFYKIQCSEDSENWCKGLECNVWFLL